MGWLEEPMDGNHGSIHPKASDYVSSGVPFIMANDLVDGKVNYNNCVYITEKQASGLRKGFAKPGDVLLTHKATIGRTAIVPDEYDTIVLTPQVTYYRAITGINNQYLKYYFDTNEFQQLFANWAGSGSTRAYLGITAQRKLPIVLPPIEVQNKIVNILSALDDKITLNNKINANLQQQAQAIFKSWFVDFEPFQDGEFVESELGPIPKGWRVGTLSELVAVKYGKDHKKLTDGPYPVYGSGGIMRYVERPIYTKESVLIPRKGTLNNVIYLNEPFWSVDTMFYTEMKMENVAKYVYHFVSGKDLASMNSGSAVPSMTTDILNSMKVVIPTAEWLAKFEQILLPLYSQMFQNAAQSKTLAQLRDTLLPKLMNGGIEATP